MGRVIDDRIVEMQFDNRNFEKNVSQSLSTLDKLKSALHIDSSSKDFNSVANAANDLGSSFNALESIATGVFRRMGSSIYDFAFKAIKDMSGIGNIVEGWKKYEQVMDSTATMFYQGFEESEIEDQQARMMWFSDETSYSFSDMADNVAKFTAAGKGLEESATALMGVSLWAASAGANSKDASRAYYQLSQAISRPMRLEDWKSIQNIGMDTVAFRQAALDTAEALGTVRKNADGTYTSLVAVSKAGKQAFSIEQFSDSLTQGQWFTSDVQMAIYQKYAGAVDQIREYAEENMLTASEAIEALDGQLDDFALNAFKAAQEARTWSAVVDSVKDALSTGWMKVFKNIFGNYGEAKEFFTDLANDLYDVFVEPLNVVNVVLEKWKKAGGRQDFMDGLLAFLHAVENILGAIGEALGSVFSRQDAYNGLIKFSKGFKNLGERLESATSNLDGLRKTFAGVFALLDLAKQLISGLLRAFAPLFGGIGSVISGIFNVTGGIGSFIVSIDEAVKEGDLFYKAFSTITKPLIIAKEKIIDFAKTIKDALPDVWSGFIKKFKEFTGIDIIEVFKKIKDWAGNVGKAFSKFWDSSQKSAYGLFGTIRDGFYNLTGLDPGSISNIFLTAFEKVSGALKGFFAWCRENLGGISGIVRGFFNILGKIFSFITNGVKKVTSNDGVNKLKSALETVWSVLKSIWSVVVVVFKAIWEYLQPVVAKIKDALSSFSVGNLGGIAAGAGGLLAGLGIKKLIDNLTGKKGPLEPIKEFINNFSSVFESFANTMNSFSHLLDAKALKTVASSILILAAAMLVISFVDLDKFAGSGTAFALFISALSGVMILLSKTTDRKVIKKIGSAFKSLGIALILIAIALRIISKIDTKELYSAVGAMSIILIVIGFVMSMIMKINDSGKNAKSQYKTLKQVSKIIMALSIGLLIIAAAISILSKIKLANLGTALLGLLGGVLAISIILLVINNKKYSSKNFKTLIGAAAALYIVALAIEKLAFFSWDQIIHGLAGLAGAAIALAFVSMVLSKNKIKVGSALSVVLIASSLNIVAKALLSYASMSWDQILHGLAGFGIAIVALSAIAVVLGEFKPSAFSGLAIIEIAASMLIFVSAIEKFGDMDANKLIQGGIAIGALAVVIALFSMVAKGGNLVLLGTGIIFLATGLLFMAGVIGILGSMPLEKLKQGGIAIAAFLGVIVLAGALALVVAPGLLILAVAFSAMAISAVGLGAGFILIATGVKMLISIVPYLAKVVIALVDSIITGLNLFLKRIPELQKNIIVFIFTMITSFTVALTESLPQVIELILTFLVAILDAIIDGHRLEKILDRLFELVTIILQALENHIGEWVEILANILFDIIMALINTTRDRIGEYADALLGLFVDVIEGVATAIDNNAQDMVDAIEHLKTAILRFLLLAITGGYVDLYDAGGEGGNQTYEGFKAKVDEVFSTIGTWLYDHLVKPIADTFKDGSDAIKKLIGVGEDILNGIWEGLQNAWEDVKEWFSNKLGALWDLVCTILDIHSPSRVMAYGGRMIAEGLGVGIKDGFSSPISEMDTGCSGLLEGFKSYTQQINDVLNTGIDSNPTITPVLDLTNLKSGASSINGMFGGLDLGSGKMNLAALASGFNMSNEGFDPNNPNSGRMVFNQYNYSPKALSATEIYRQTRNQLSGAKGVVIQKR